MSFSTRNTRTEKAERALALICLVGAVMVLVVVAVLLHGLWATAQDTLDTIRDGGSQGCIGGAA